MDEYQWTNTHLLGVSGFPAVLWETLTRFGYTQRPAYRAREYVENGTQRCEVHVTIPQTAEHPDWDPITVTAFGAEYADTYQAAARQALTLFCEKHEREVGHTPSRFFPPSDYSRPAWLRRMETLEGVGQREDDPTLIATVRYLLALDGLYEAHRQEWRVSVHRAEEAEARERDLRAQLEQAQTEIAELEETLRSTIKVWNEDVHYLVTTLNETYSRCHTRHGGPNRRFTVKLGPHRHTHLAAPTYTSSDSESSGGSESFGDAADQFSGGSQQSGDAQHSAGAQPSGGFLLSAGSDAEHSLEVMVVPGDDPDEDMEDLPDTDDDDDEEVDDYWYEAPLELEDPRGDEDFDPDFEEDPEEDSEPEDYPVREVPFEDDQSEEPEESIADNIVDFTRDEEDAMDEEQPAVQEQPSGPQLVGDVDLLEYFRLLGDGELTDDGIDLAAEWRQDHGFDA